jgi:hypothetical protein
MDEVSYFVEDRKTKVLVNYHTRARDERLAKRFALAELRRALLPENIGVGWPSTDGVRSIHASICACAACGGMGLRSEEATGE